jgi:hypothetical protein
MAEINVNNVTNTEGTGTFDVLMDSINLRIESQYNANRITGSDYANVYLGSIQAALAQSIQFNLQKDLVEEQTSSAYTERVLKDKQAAKLGLDNVMKSSEVSRDADDDFIYTPKYVKGT